MPDETAFAKGMKINGCALPRVKVWCTDTGLYSILPTCATQYGNEVQTAIMTAKGSPFIETPSAHHHWIHTTAPQLHVQVLH